MITTIVFDLGGVLIDWDPRYLYRKVFSDKSAMEHFLSTICTPSWNEEQDAGRTLQEATDMLIAQHPKQADLIRLFYDRWEDMLNGPIEKNLAVFRRLREAGNYPIYALTNWSAETMPRARPQFPFLEEFDGMVVSGEEMCKKPDHKIYRILFDRYELDPKCSVFLDDNQRNILAAAELGMSTIHISDDTDIEAELLKMNVKI